MALRPYCTALAAAALLGVAALVSAQPPAPVPGDAVFAIFLRGTQIGREQWTLARTESGWIITSNGRLAAPVDYTVNRFEMKYGTDWQPMEMRLEARVRNVGVVIQTSFSVTSAINEIAQLNTKGAKTDQISARTVVLPNNVFAAYEALAVRLWDAQPGAELPAYVVPTSEIKVKVRGVTPETLQGPAGSIATRRFDLTMMNADRPINAAVVVDERRRLVRVESPDVGLQAVREDVSTVAVRAQTARNPTDADVTIPANGFNLAGTLTTPPIVAGRLRFPAVVLVGGMSPSDRDQVLDGVPVFAQLAGALAGRGILVLRYDRRGAGQSGGRTDSATLQDYADDAVAAVRWMGKRDDVDNNHITVAGHLDGAPVALLAAAASKDVDGVITIDAAGLSGADLILLQQQKLLDELKVGDADRQARVEMQKKIQSAVVNGKGWEGVAPAMRKQADTPWFKSVLTYDPARVLPNTKQPMLILHGDLDPTVPASEADRLGELAKARKKAEPVEVVHLADAGRSLTVPGVGRVSDKAIDAIAAWIKKQ
jgi:pimeloyl-ACP methyl ester carboxylesterase